jgi:hypothetical protein
MSSKTSALDVFFSGFLDGVDDKALILDHAKCHALSARESLGEETTRSHSTPKLNRWDVGEGRISLGFPFNPPPSSRKRAVENDEVDLLSTSVEPGGDGRCDSTKMGQNDATEFQSSSPKSTLEKRSVRMNEEVSVISISPSGWCDILLDTSESVRLKYPSSPPSSVEKRRASLKKKLMATSRWESENQKLSLYQLMSHSPPIRPTRRPNLINVSDLDIVSLQENLEAIKKMQVQAPYSSSARTQAVDLPQSLRNLPYK